MRPLLALPLAALLATTALAADAPAPPAEDVLERLAADGPAAERDAWFEATVKGKPVAWTAPTFNVTTAFGLVIVNTKVSSRGLVACQVPKRLEAKAKNVPAGEPVLCIGRVEDYERLLGAALVNVVADDIVIGKPAIDAWQAKQPPAKR